MQLIIQTLFVTTFVAGTSCQKITFDNTDAGGIKAGRFYIDGTIGENVTELLHQNWVPVITIEVMRISASRFRYMCSFVVSGGTCTPDPVRICQCVYNTTTGNVHFVVNGTAGPDLYKAIIRAEWEHRNKTIVYSNKNYTVPEPDVTTTTSTTTSTTASTPTSPTTSPTTESPGSSSSSTGSVLFSNTTSANERGPAEKGSCPLFFCDLYLAFSLLFLELLGGVAYGIIWCIFFKKEKGNDASATSV